MAILSEIKKRSIALLNAQRAAGEHSDTLDNKVLRGGYIASISEKFDNLIAEENVEKWEDLLTYLMEKRIALYTESMNKARLGGSSTFGDALRAVHETLIQYLQQEAHKNSKSIAAQVIAKSSDVLNIHNQSYGSEKWYMNLLTSEDRKAAEKSRITAAAFGNFEVLGWASPTISLSQGGLFGAPAKFWAATHPVLTQLPRKLNGENTQVNAWKNQIANPTTQQHDSEENAQMTAAATSTQQTTAVARGTTFAVQATHAPSGKQNPLAPTPFKAPENL